MANGTQFVIRITRKATATLGPDTTLIADGRGRPMIFNSEKNANDYKERLEKMMTTPDISYRIEPFHEKKKG